MKSILTLVLIAIIAAGTAGAAMVDTFLPGNPTVRYAVNADGFKVNSTGFTWYGSTVQATAIAMTSNNSLFDLEAGGSGYSDAGIVLYFDGSLTLGQLNSVTISTIGGNTTPIVNLWLDSGANNQFFAFSGDAFTGLAGDSYSGAAVAGNINGSTNFYMLGGNGRGGTYTLADLKTGIVSGIDANTKVALWIGINGSSDYQAPNNAYISQIETSVPEPATMAMLAVGGLALLRRKSA